MKKNQIIAFVILLLPIFLFSKNYNIVDFGAVADGKTLNTQAIQNAINQAHQNGGGRVVIPEGKFLCGSIVMKSGVELHLEENAVLLGSTNIDHYLKINRWKALVMADHQEDISITGYGTLDGQGRQLALHIDSLFYAGKIDSARYNFNEMRPKWYLRPQVIEFVKCKNIVVKNVTIKNAACWVQTYDVCENLTIDNIHVESDAYWNNDGIDIQDSKNVRLTNSYFNAADDGICIKSQYKEHLCDSIVIENCTVRSSASAVKFGTVSHGGFKNVTIKNIKVFDTFRSAIAVECVDGGILENVLVDGIEAVNTGNPIFIRLGDRNPKRPPGKLRNVTLKNIKVQVPLERPDYDYDLRGPALPFFHNIFPSSIVGIPGHPVENVTLENIEIIYPGRGNNGLANAPLDRLESVPEKIAHYPEFSMFGELPAWGFYVRHVDGLNMKNVNIKIEAADYRPAFVFDDVKNLTMRKTKIEGDEKAQPVILHKVEKVNLEEPTLIFSKEKNSEEMAVRAALKKFSEAYKKADLKILSEMLTENYVHSNSGAPIIRKKDWLGWVDFQGEKMAAGALSYSEYFNENVVVEIYGKTAVVHGVNISKGKKDGQPFEQKIAFTHTWVKEWGVWKRASFHDSKIETK